jgi:hypothetical protein
MIAEGFKDINDFKASKKQQKKLRMYYAHPDGEPSGFMIAATTTNEAKYLGQHALLCDYIDVRVYLVRKGQIYFDDLEQGPWGSGFEIIGDGFVELKGEPKELDWEDDVKPILIKLGRAKLFAATEE